MEPHCLQPPPLRKGGWELNFSALASCKITEACPLLQCPELFASEQREQAEGKPVPQTVMPALSQLVSQNHPAHNAYPESAST